LTDWLFVSSATLEVLADDDQLQSSPVMTRLLVSVRDVNDNPPVIELMPATAVTSPGRDGDVTTWRLEVAEHARNGTFVGHVMVSDADASGQQRVTCSLRQPTDDHQYQHQHTVSAGGFNSQTSRPHRMHAVHMWWAKNRTVFES